MNVKQNILYEKLKIVKDLVIINEFKLSEVFCWIKVVELQKKFVEKCCQCLLELEGQFYVRLLEVNKIVEELQLSL